MPPPTPIDAVYRFMILQKIAGLAYLGTGWTVMEKTLASRPPEEQDAFRQKLGETAAALNGPLLRPPLDAALSPKERQYLSHPMSAWPKQDMLDASWRIEAAQTVAWALGLVDTLPPSDTRAPKDLFKTLTQKNPNLSANTATLRPLDDLLHARSVAELWHWRSRTRQMVEQNQPFEPNDAMRAAGLHTLDDIIRLTAHKAAAAGDIPAPIAGDFPAKNKAYRDLTPAEWAEVRSITMERHVTLNWLCGRSPNNAWDETPTPT